MISNCGTGEDSWESLGQQGDQTSQSECWNQSIWINSECSLEGLMVKLKLWYFGHLMWRADSLEKTLILGKTEGRKRRGWQRRRWLDSITNSLDMSLSQLWKIVKDRKAWRVAVHGVTKVRNNLVTGQQWFSLNITSNREEVGLFIYFSQTKANGNGFVGDTDKVMPSVWVEEIKLIKIQHEDKEMQGELLLNR